MAAVLCAGSPPPAQAGPPLVSDDPNTIGARRVEAILFGAWVSQDVGQSWNAPQLDLTVGLQRGLDGLLVAGPVFDRDSGETRRSGLVEAGVKWQPLQTGAWNASLTPTLAVAFLDEGSTTSLVLPVQVERVFGSAALGVDGGYLVVPEGDDGWRAAVYGSWSPAPTLTLLAELWSEGAPDSSQRDAGAGGGFEAMVAPGWSLLGALGTGIASHRADRIEWTGYLGVLWRFRIRQRDAGAQARFRGCAPRCRRSSAKSGTPSAW